MLALARAGFSLLEVLMAMLLISLALITINQYALINQGAMQAIYLQAVATARLQGVNLLNRFNLDTKPWLEGEGINISKLPTLIGIE